MSPRTVALALALLAVPAFAATYGSGVNLTTPTRVSALLADPAAHLGQTVLVEGLVVDVCAKRGCWLELASDQKHQTLSVQVPDGVIVFPLSARGRVARIQGVLAEVPRSAAEEKWGWQGGPAQPPAPRYLLRATGAVIP